MNKNQANFWLDVTFFSIFVQVLMPGVTGLEHHQWAGIALLAGVIIHLLRHRQWITAVIQHRTFRRPGRVRRTFWLNALLGIAFVWTMVSGLAIAPLLGNEPSEQLVRLHIMGVALFFVSMLIHLRAHRKWIGQSFKRYMVGVYAPESRARLPK